MGTGNLTVTQVTDFVLKLQYVFWIVVIFETVMSTGHKTQKESYPYQEDLRILFIYFFLFYFFLLLLLLLLFLSVAEVLLVCCICTRNLW